MAVKLKDIAKASGVSISTVSRVLSHDTSRSVSKVTEQRVLDAAQELGYFSQRLASARFMELQAGQKSASVACVLTSEHETYVSPFFASLLRGIQQEVQNLESSFPLNFFVTYIKDPGFLHFIQNTQLDCAIMLGRTTLENIELLQKQVPFLVYAGVNRLDCGVDEVVCDAQLAVEGAIGYLAEMGHSRIGFIGPLQEKNPVFNEHRYQGYLKAMEELGLAVDESTVVDTILTASDGYESASKLIAADNLPTALICGNDTVAMGVMKALDEQGIQVPDDISLIGFDNSEVSTYLKPALTTIDIPKQELGRLAVKVLVDRLETNRSYPLTVTLPFTLLKRESVRALAEGVKTTAQKRCEA